MNSSTKQILVVSHLSKQYPKTKNHVLADISFSVEKGDFISFIGQSGCGKSTLFTILAGIENQTNGSISFAGEELSDRRGQFGYMPQKPLLLPWRTVLQNICLGMEISGEKKEIATEKAKKLLKKFTLESFSQHFPNTLSGGMAQRIALLRTVLFNDRFLLLDEPFGALDALTRQSLQFWLQTVYQKIHPTVALITHDIREAILLSDKIYVLSKRPAKIKKEIVINLPRPRTYDIFSLPHVIQLEQELMKLLL